MIEAAKTQLTRLSITGEIDDTTPLCVLEEIANAHWFKYKKEDKNHLLKNIAASPIQTVTTNIPDRDITDWEKIARFVNKNHQWPQGKLSVAFNFLMKFVTTKDPLPKIPITFECGAQTPDSLYSINACVLYKICKYHNIKVDTNTTLHQMAFGVKMLRESPDSIIRRAKYFIEKDARVKDMINLLVTSSYDVRDPEINTVADVTFNHYPNITISHELLHSVYNSLNDIKVLQSKINPTTETGAIALAAINYNIDISKTLNPNKEYSNMVLQGRNQFVPIDAWMKHWFEKNTLLFDLTVTFNPLFSQDFYSNANLHAMVVNEGYIQTEITNASEYELLQLAYVSETFYIGEMPNLKTRQTVIDLDDVDEIPYGELVCFGQIDAPLEPASMTELTNLFNANQNYTNPFQKNSVFTQTAIHKLKLIAQSLTGPVTNKMLTPETLQVRARLLDAIIGVEIMIQSTDGKTRQFLLAYRNSSLEIKRNVQNALTKLLHVGMFFRGWDGKGNYPVLKAPVPHEKEAEIALCTTEAMRDYNTQIRALNDIGTLLNDLPLVIYKDNEYQASTKSSDGLTIRDRLAIVRDGETTDNIASCIRLSSNWICSSAHKYITAIGLPSPFDVFDLRYIS
jgi:hypothetical protein